MKLRIEENYDTGEFFIIIPEEILEEMGLDIGHPLEVSLTEDNELILTP